MRGVPPLSIALASRSAPPRARRDAPTAKLSSDEAQASTAALRSVPEDGTLAMAVGAVIELPSRHFGPQHRALLSEDVEALCRFFLHAAHGVLEEPVVRSSLGFLHALAEQACEQGARA